ncbi:MAG: exosome complex exonuclease Rrp41 [Candidatus Thermoplasmatota archaeon]|nr:exosome complex exonuclease Rrp41 [Candidatus Thermoplasmatota archaeon]MBU1941307.1 exosome complex exonuclease Rrp41 [Candidatus Thermoplasmatota archaeon]
MKTEDVKLIDAKGIRLDGRKIDELRPIKIESGVLHRADGSCYLEWGGNKVFAAVYGPREAIPRHTQNPLRAIVNAKYNMAAFSVEDRKRPGPDRRSREISKVISEALEKVILTEQFPRSMIDVAIEVLDAEAGTRCAGLTAAGVALADAGIPMIDIPVGCAAGKIGGKVVLDLGKEEDNFGDADVPLGISPRTGEIILLQMDGHLTFDEFNTALDYAIEGCNKVSKLQKEALLRKYDTIKEGK